MPASPQIATDFVSSKPSAASRAFQSFLSAASCAARYAAVTACSLGEGADAIERLPCTQSPWLTSGSEGVDTGTSNSKLPCLLCWTLPAARPAFAFSLLDQLRLPPSPSRLLPPPPFPPPNH